MMTTEDQLLIRIALLLNQVGDRGTCKGCGAPIWWIRTRSGKAAPYTAEALNHFADCPAAARFRKGVEEEME